MEALSQQFPPLLGYHPILAAALIALMVVGAVVEMRFWK
jgi:hypothetical protein